MIGGSCAAASVRSPRSGGTDRSRVRGELVQPSYPPSPPAFRRTSRSSSRSRTFLRRAVLSVSRSVGGSTGVSTRHPRGRRRHGAPDTTVGVNASGFGALRPPRPVWLSLNPVRGGRTSGGAMGRLPDERGGPMVQRPGEDGSPVLHAGQPSLLGPRLQRARRRAAADGPDQRICSAQPQGAASRLSRSHRGPHPVHARSLAFVAPTGRRQQVR